MAGFIIGTGGLLITLSSVIFIISIGPLIAECYTNRGGSLYRGYIHSYSLFCWHSSPLAAGPEEPEEEESLQCGGFGADRAYGEVAREHFCLPEPSFTAHGIQTAVA